MMKSRTMWLAGSEVPLISDNDPDSTGSRPTTLLAASTRDGRSTGAVCRPGVLLLPPEFFQKHSFEILKIFEIFENFEIFKISKIMFGNFRKFSRFSTKISIEHFQYQHFKSFSEKKIQNCNISKKLPKNFQKYFFEWENLHDEIIFFDLVFFCDLENTYTFIKTSSERWIASTTTPSRPSVVFPPLFSEIRVDLP